jgi:microcystin-dependent protein
MPAFFFQAPTVPHGFIGMWSGTVDMIPSGWVLCDGTNSTPDLTDRFIVGAGDTYDPGDTGGESTHKLTVSELPSVGIGASNRMVIKVGTALSSCAVGVLPVVNSVTTSTITPGDTAHENRPPYYALCFIMKV